MQLDDILNQLQALGTEQNRKTYRNHGVKGDQFGVSFANLDKLAKHLRKDKTLDKNGLAASLWTSGIHDARLLAIKLADPSQFTTEMLDKWVLDLDNYIITDAFSDLASKTPFANEKMNDWKDSDNEWISAAGWNLVSLLAMHDEKYTDGDFMPYLDQIQAEIHNRPNRTRYAMNNALIALGIRNPTLENRALQAAQEIGPVDVDHGVTNCKTPFATDYIRKTWAYREKKQGS